MFGSSAPAFDVEIVRKPDPAIKIAMYRPESKKTLAFLQIFDYNIDRVEGITDKRGLEKLLIIAIASCLDVDFDERYRDPQTNLFMALADIPKGINCDSPTPFSAPQPLDENEVFLTPLVEPAHLVQHCIDLLRTGGAAPSLDCASASEGCGLEFIIIQAYGEDMAKRALGVAERVKLGFYRLLAERRRRLHDATVPEELFMYVRPLEPSAGSIRGSSFVSNQDTGSGSTGLSSTARPRIDLDSNRSKKSGTASPARSELGVNAAITLSGIKIFLSKLRLEELEAEQVQSARLRRERQSQSLAEFLQRKQTKLDTVARTSQSVVGSVETDSDGTVSRQSFDSAMTDCGPVSTFLRENRACLLPRLVIAQDADYISEKVVPISCGPVAPADEEDDVSASDWSNESCASSDDGTVGREWHVEDVRNPNSCTHGHQIVGKDATNCPQILETQAAKSFAASSHTPRHSSTLHSPEAYGRNLSNRPKCGSRCWSALADEVCSEAGATLSGFISFLLCSLLRLRFPDDRLF